jgi:hypothetical protein
VTAVTHDDRVQDLGDVLKPPDVGQLAKFSVDSAVDRVIASGTAVAYLENKTGLSARFGKYTIAASQGRVADRLVYVIDGARARCAPAGSDLPPGSETTVASIITCSATLVIDANTAELVLMVERGEQG